MTETATAPIFLAPSWIGVDNNQCVDLIDGRDGAHLELSGTLREAFLAGRLLQEPSAAALARLNPLVERLFSSLVAADAGPLDRSLLLRGTGWTRLFLELTGQCNERCQHCYAGASPDVQQSLDEEVVIDALIQAKDMGFTAIQLTGGDPLLSSTCVPAASKARELGFPLIEVYTNGLALKGQLFSDLAELDVSFAFSLYGQDPLVHDAVTRVSGSHRRTLEAIERTAKAGLNLRVGIIDTGTTGFNLEATRQLAISLGVPPDAFGSDVQREVGRGVFQKVKDETTTASLQTITPPALSPREMTGAFAGTAAVAYDGQIYPCIFSRDLPLGSVYDGGLAAVLERPSPVTNNFEGLFDAAMSWADRLTCWKCRLRAAVLSSDSVA